MAAKFPFDMTDLAPTLGVLMVAMGKFGELAERFVNAHETIAGNLERLTKLAESEGLAETKRLTDAAVMLGEAVEGMLRAEHAYQDYDRNRGA
jgi:hypothetical protein